MLSRYPFIRNNKSPQGDGKCLLLRHNYECSYYTIKKHITPQGDGKIKAGGNVATLYVNEQGSVVGVDGGYYVVKQKNDLLRKIPKETLEAITLFGNVHLTEPCV